MKKNATMEIKELMQKVFLAIIEDRVITSEEVGREVIVEKRLNSKDGKIISIYFSKKEYDEINLFESIAKMFDIKSQRYTLMHSTEIKLDRSGGSVSYYLEIRATKGKKS